LVLKSIPDETQKVESEFTLITFENMSKIFVKVEVFAEIEVDGNDRLVTQKSIVDTVKSEAERKIIQVFNSNDLNDLPENILDLTLLDSESFLDNFIENLEENESSEIPKHLQQEADDLDRILGVKLISTRAAVSSMNILR